jgi:hypothetical protein
MHPALTCRRPNARRGLYEIFSRPARILTSFLLPTRYRASRFVSRGCQMDIIYIALLVGCVLVSIPLVCFFEHLRRPQ